MTARSIPRSIQHQMKMVDPETGIEETVVFEITDWRIERQVVYELINSASEAYIEAVDVIDPGNLCINARVISHKVSNLRGKG